MFDTLWGFFLVPIGLGLLGFIEPCSIGASLLFLKSVEGNPPAVKTMQAIVFTITRALFIGALGAAAALIGAAFLQFQRGGYLLLGTLYVALGLIYLVGKAGWLMRTVGPRLSRLSTVRGSAALAIFFGLNIPACSVPLLAAVLGSAAVAGAAQVWQGFSCWRCSGLRCRCRCWSRWRSARRNGCLSGLLNIQRGCRSSSDCSLSSSAHGRSISVGRRHGLANSYRQHDDAGKPQLSAHELRFCAFPSVARRSLSNPPRYSAMTPIAPLPATRSASAL